MNTRPQRSEMFGYIKYRKFLVIVWHITFSLLTYIHFAASECNVCQSNQAACINSTSFYLCFGGNVPNIENLYHCKDGFDCTELNAICVQSSSMRRPSCGDTSLCGQCSAHRNHLFACLSRTTFQMCYGAIRPTGQIGKCPQGYVCDASNDGVCVAEESLDSVTCDVVDDGGIVTTPGPGEENGDGGVTTPDPNENMTPLKVCREMRQVGLYPTSPTDPHCKRYIYCFYENGIIHGLEYTCSSGTYYHIQQKQCVFNKPTYCL